MKRRTLIKSAALGLVLPASQLALPDFIIDPYRFVTPYLLRATFTAGDQTFSDAQVLDTAAEGVEMVSLTVKDTGAGDWQIVSNQLKNLVASNFNETAVI